MKHYITFVLIFLPMQVGATIYGNGNIDFGVSKDEEHQNFGVAAKYNLEASGPNTVTNFKSSLQVGSEEGRSLVATAAHEYQYEQSYIRSEISNNLQFYYPGVTWGTQLSHGLEFKKKTDIGTNKTETDFSNTESRWSITTGPKYEYNRSDWLNYRTEFQASQLNISGEESVEGVFSFGVGKSITHTSTSYLDFTKICTEYGTSTKEDECREEARLSVVVQTMRATLHAEAGVAQNSLAKTDVYSLSFYKPINSYSTISIFTKKSIDKISEIDQFNLPDEDVFSSAVKTSDSISYVYDWGRKKFEVKGRKLTTEAGGISLKSKDAIVHYTYQLGSRLCYACQVGLSYEYSDYGNEVEKSIRSISIAKNHSRRFSSAISFRETALSNEFNTWSINLLLSVKDLVANLRTR